MSFLADFKLLGCSLWLSPCLRSPSCSVGNVGILTWSFSVVLWLNMAILRFNILQQALPWVSSPSVACLEEVSSGVKLDAAFVVYNSCGQVCNFSLDLLTLWTDLFYPGTGLVLGWVGCLAVTSAAP